MRYILISLMLTTLIAVSCKPAGDTSEPPTKDTTKTILTVSSKTIELGAHLNATIKFTITTNADWSVETSMLDTFRWLSVSPRAGKAGTHDITLRTITSNEIIRDRKGMIQIRAGELTQRINIVQLREHNLEVGYPRYSIPCRDSMISLIVKCNHEYTIAVPDQFSDWIRRDIIEPTPQTKVLEEHVEKFYITQNNSRYEPREGFVVVSMGDTSVTAPIFQESVEWALKVTEPGLLWSMARRSFDWFSRTRLKVSGELHSDDFVFLKTEVKGLKYLDLSDVVAEQMPGEVFELTPFEQVILPNNLKRVPDAAFLNAHALRSVILPEGLEAIGQVAFSGCRKLTSITIPRSVRDIEQSAFSGCDFIEFAIPSGVINVGPYAFSFSSLEAVNIAPTVETIGTGAFASCRNLSYVVLPSSVTQLGVDVFNGCLILELVELPDNIGYVPMGAFSGCVKLTQVNIPKSVTKIGSSAFRGCISLKTIVVPESVKLLQNEAFAECTSLKSVTLQGDLNSIGASAFYNCLRLEDVNIPGTVTVIDHTAFSNCASLTKITIPESVKTIREGAFYNTSRLMDITVLATEPPVLEFEDFRPFGTPVSGRKFRVPALSIQAYKNDPQWSYYASEIVAI